MLSFKQSHAEIQDILNNAGSGGDSGTTDYTDLENKPSINSVTLTGNKTTADLGIKDVPTITSEDTGKYLKANYNSGEPVASWETVSSGGADLPTITSTDTGKVLVADYNSGDPQMDLGDLKVASTYIELNGAKVYISSTEPTGTIANGSFGFGW